MNWFTCNYMNLVANGLYMLSMLSMSMSTALLDTRQAFHMNLVVTIVVLVQTDLWVLYMLSYLVCFDYGIWVDCSAGSCVCPFVLCVPSQVGIDPFQPRTHLHPYLPPFVLEPLIHLLNSLQQSHPCYWQSYLTYLCATSWSRHYLTTHCWDSYTKQFEV